MKYTYLNFSIALTILIVFSSCGSLSISQKRYSNGLNISWFQGKDDNSVKTPKTNKNKQPKQNSSIAAENDETFIVNEETNEIYPVNESTVLSTPVLNTKNNSAKSSKSHQAISDTKTKGFKFGFKKQASHFTQLAPESVDETHESSGLKAIGWILIIIGLIFLLIVSLLVGLLLMLVGLLFVVAGN